MHLKIAHLQYFLTVSSRRLCCTPLSLSHLTIHFLKRLKYPLLLLVLRHIDLFEARLGGIRRMQIVIREFFIIVGQLGHRLGAPQKGLS